MCHRRNASTRRSLPSNRTKTIHKNSILIRYHPFIDGDGLIHVGGRIMNSSSSYAFIHPILLHHKHIITKRIIENKHIRLLHAGVSLVTSSIGRIISARKIVRSVLRNCIICRRQTGKTYQQLQGQLPTERINPGSVFERVGLDYAGPINTCQDTSNRQGLHLFVCFSVCESCSPKRFLQLSDVSSHDEVTLRLFGATMGPILSALTIV